MQSRKKNGTHDMQSRKKTRKNHRQLSTNQKKSERESKMNQMSFDLSEFVSIPITYNASNKRVESASASGDRVRCGVVLAKQRSDLARFASETESFSVVRSVLMLRYGLFSFASALEFGDGTFRVLFGNCAGGLHGLVLQADHPLMSLLLSDHPPLFVPASTIEALDDLRRFVVLGTELKADGELMHISVLTQQRVSRTALLHKSDAPILFGALATENVCWVDCDRVTLAVDVVAVQRGSDDVDAPVNVTLQLLRGPRTITVTTATPLRYALAQSLSAGDAVSLVDAAGLCVLDARVLVAAVAAAADGLISVTLALRCGLRMITVTAATPRRYAIAQSLSAGDTVSLIDAAGLCVLDARVLVAAVAAAADSGAISVTLALRCGLRTISVTAATPLRYALAQSLSAGDAVSLIDAAGLCVLDARVLVAAVAAAADGLISVTLALRRGLRMITVTAATPLRYAIAQSLSAGDTVSLIDAAGLCVLDARVLVAAVAAAADGLISVTLALRCGLRTITVTAATPLRYALAQSLSAGDTVSLIDAAGLCVLDARVLVAAVAAAADSGAISVTLALRRGVHSFAVTLATPQVYALAQALSAGDVVLMLDAAHIVSASTRSVLCSRVVYLDADTRRLTLHPKSGEIDVTVSRSKAGLWNMIEDVCDGDVVLTTTALALTASAAVVRVFDIEACEIAAGKKGVRATFAQRSGSEIYELPDTHKCYAKLLSLAPAGEVPLEFLLGVAASRGVSQLVAPATLSDEGVQLQIVGQDRIVTVPPRSAHFAEAVALVSAGLTEIPSHVAGRLAGSDVFFKVVAITDNVRETIDVSVVQEGGVAAGKTEQLVALPRKSGWGKKLLDGKRELTLQELASVKAALANHFVTALVTVGGILSLTYDNRGGNRSSTYEFNLALCDVGALQVLGALRIDAPISKAEITTISAHSAIDYSVAVDGDQVRLKPVGVDKARAIAMPSWSYVGAAAVAAAAANGGVARLSLSQTQGSAAGGGGNRKWYAVAGEAVVREVALLGGTEEQPERVMVFEGKRTESPVDFKRVTRDVDMRDNDVKIGTSNLTLERAAAPGEQPLRGLVFGRLRDASGGDDTLDRYVVQLEVGEAVQERDKKFQLTLYRAVVNSGTATLTYTQVSNHVIHVTKQTKWKLTWPQLSATGPKTIRADSIVRFGKRFSLPCWPYVIDVQRAVSPLAAFAEQK
jgi:hypothetical protein